jgi:hypothetical protein
MSILLWARFVLLVAMAGVVVLLIWAERQSID